MRGSMLTSAALVTVLLVLSGACGGDDDNKDESANDTGDDADDESGGEASKAEYVAAITESIERSDDGGFGDQDTNACVAGVYVDVIGVDELRETVTPDEIVAQPDAQPEDFGLAIDPADLWDGLNDCVDLGPILLDQFSGGDDAVTECMLAATTDDQRRELFVAGYNEQEPDPAVLAAFTAAATQCGATTTTG